MKFFMEFLAGIVTLLLLLIRRKKYNISYLLFAAILIIVGIIGYFGSSFASFLAYSTFKGMRFYGKVLFVTFVLYVLERLFKCENGHLMDYYAPIDIAALVIMKINCMRTGCCSGVPLFVNSEGITVYFPSQIAELLVALSIFLIVLLLEKKSKFDGRRYYLYVILYSSTRFVFEFLREDKGKCIGDILSIGHLFCALLLLISVIGLYFINKKQKDNCILDNDT